MANDMKQDGISKGVWTVDSLFKTIHRCQGDTLNELVVDLPSTTREHMHYVALSRARNISGLHILNLNEKKVSVSLKVREEMQRQITTITTLYSIII